MFLANGCVPESFGKSYTVPIPKSNVCNRALTVDDSRGISISPVISKLFEHAIVDCYAHYFVTSDNKFGFKKHLGNQTIYSYRVLQLVDDSHYVTFIYCICHICN